MKRLAISFLTNWLLSPDRKPLVIRGARQVGKTWIIRHLADMHKKTLIELNLEKRPEFVSFFSSNNPKEIILHLSAYLNVPIDPAASILFLDEIQAVPELLAKLRWFAEDMPQLPVIAAGSLLEFVLEHHQFSMPVGRINYMHLEPFSFQEFLLAHEKEILNDYLNTYQLNTQIPAIMHQQLLSLFKEYLIIGGMPHAVQAWVRERSLQKINQIHQDLLATYRDDFSKYSGRIATQRLDEVMLAVPKYLGEKFVYTRVNPAIKINAIKQSLDLLCKARICHRVVGSAANGVPLGAEIQEKYLKIIFLDVGLCSSILGLSLNQLQGAEEIDLINKGAMAEQVVGQLLRTVFPIYKEPELYCWRREEKGSNAEIDYIVQHHNVIIPIEVKAGSTGSMKSLHLFMGAKNLSRAVRVNSDVPSQVAVSVKDVIENQIEYTLLSLPFYLVEQLHRLLG